MSASGKLPVIPECPKGKDPEKALEACVLWAQEAFQTACIPTHAVVGALLLSRQLGVDTALRHGVRFDHDLAERLSESYCVNFRIGEETTIAHLSAMLSAAVKALVLGQREPRAPAVVGS